MSRGFNTDHTGVDKLIGFVRQYAQQVNLGVFLAATTLTALLVFCNYFFDWETRITAHPSYFIRLTGMWLIFLLVFAGPWFFYRMAGKKNGWSSPQFIFLLFFAPLLFAFKYVFEWPLEMADRHWRDFWQYILHWPALALFVTGILFIIWRTQKHPRSFYGTTGTRIDWSPYVTALLCMIPLVLLAAAQKDFQQVYPKLQLISEGYYGDTAGWWKPLLFELSYGSDFFTIELFFRGFLVLAFTRWFGAEAILPMACFYCTIHFGKPLGECISSYFGGLLLGIIAYHTRSIWGGLFVHLGIAWMMELVGWVVGG